MRILPALRQVRAKHSLFRSSTRPGPLSLIVRRECWQAQCLANREEKNKTMSIQNTLKTSIFAVAILLLGSATATAGPVNLTFKVNTSSLVGLGEFYLAFELADADPICCDSNNTVTLSKFNFDGGSADGVAALVGGASGSLPSGLTLIDSTFFNAAVQGFTAGTFVYFTATFGNNLDEIGRGSCRERVQMS